MPNRRKQMVRIFQGKLKATCDAQKGTRQGRRPKPAESDESDDDDDDDDDDEDFPRPGLRCHKLFHPQCHL